MQREMFSDKKFMAALEGAGAEGGDAAGGGDLGGDLDLGGDTGGDDLGGDLDLGGDTGGDTGGGEEEEPDLLAEPPAKRDDGSKRRGPYKKHKISYRKGGFSKQMKNQAFGGEVRGSTARTTFPGKVGFGGLDSLSRGIYESDVKEEDKLFNIDADIKNLLESLNRKESEDET